MTYDHSPDYEHDNRDDFFLGKNEFKGKSYDLYWKNNFKGSKALFVAQKGIVEYHLESIADSEFRRTMVQNCQRFAFDITNTQSVGDNGSARRKDQPHTPDEIYLGSHSHRNVLYDLYVTCPTDQQERTLLARSSTSEEKGMGIFVNASGDINEAPRHPLVVARQRAIANKLLPVEENIIGFSRRRDAEVLKKYLSSNYYKNKPRRPVFIGFSAEKAESARKAIERYNKEFEKLHGPVPERQSNRLIYAFKSESEAFSYCGTNWMHLKAVDVSEAISMFERSVTFEYCYEKHVKSEMLQPVLVTDTSPSIMQLTAPTGASLTRSE